MQQLRETRIAHATTCRIQFEETLRMWELALHKQSFVRLDPNFLLDSILTEYLENACAMRFRLANNNTNDTLKAKKFFIICDLSLNCNIFILIAKLINFLINLSNLFEKFIFDYK